MPRNDVLPENWHRAFLERADLEASFAALGESRHFYAEAMRGRIRSLELRVEDARVHFRRASVQAAVAAPTVPNLVRQFLLHLYAFENSLLAEPLDRAADHPPLEIPELGAEVCREYPEVAYVVELRKEAEGRLRLHLGDPRAARRVFQDLVRSYGRGPDAALSLHYSGLAAAEHDVGFRRLAARTLENAGLALAAGGHVLERAHAAAVLVAIHSFLGHAPEAGDWRSFLDRIPCPPATRDAFGRRAALMVERCSRGGRLLLL